MNLYTYAGMIKNKKEEKRIMEIVTAIVENDLIDDMMAEWNGEGIDELRNLGEDILADAIYERILSPQPLEDPLIDDVFTENSEIIRLDDGHVVIRELDKEGNLVKETFGIINGGIFTNVLSK